MSRRHLLRKRLGRKIVDGDMMKVGYQCFLSLLVLSSD